MYISRVKIKRNTIKIIENAPPSIGANGNPVKKYTHDSYTQSYMHMHIHRHRHKHRHRHTQTNMYTHRHTQDVYIYTCRYM